MHRLKAYDVILILVSVALLILPARGIYGHTTISCTGTMHIPSVDATGTEGLYFDGATTYLEVADRDDLSVITTGHLSISLWMKPTVLQFPATCAEGYVYVLGKGAPHNYEWAFRLYSSDNIVGRENRVSFYLWNLSGGLGVGSYIQEPLVLNEFIHIVATVDHTEIRLYTNAVLKDTDNYVQGNIVITPQNGGAPLRIGTRDFQSYFKGYIADIAVFNKTLNLTEIHAIYEGNRSLNMSRDSGSYTASSSLIAWIRLNEV